MEDSQFTSESTFLFFSPQFSPGNSRLAITAASDMVKIAFVTTEAALKNGQVKVVNVVALRKFLI